MLFIFSFFFLLINSGASVQAHQELQFACNRHDDSLVLVKFYQSTDGPNWISKWNLNTPMIQWTGVVTDFNGCVTELHLNGNNLNGNIPSEIGNLTGLKIVSLIANKLNGSIPLTIGNLMSLEDLTLEDNQLEGSIPTQISNLINLKYLNLSKNLLSGNIPGPIGNLGSCIILNLSFNQLSGAIPNTIATLSKLKILDLSHNLLSGLVPASLSQLTTIFEIYLNDNLLSGNLSPTLSNLIFLVHFWISDNKFTGAVPDLRAAPLNSLHIENNSFDQIPDYSTVTTWGNQYPFGLVITGNRFTFLDLIPLTKILPKYFYDFNPQDPVTLDSILFVPVGTTYIIMTGVDPGLTENNFKWFKDTSVVYISNRNIYELIQVSDADEGYYSGRITNPLFANFELLIAKFRVVVYDPNSCDIPQASNFCKAAPEFCSTLTVHGYCGSLGVSDTTTNVFLCDSLEMTHNPRWVSFIASTDSIVFEIFPRNCLGIDVNGISYTGMQAAIWNSCGGNSDSIVVCQSVCNDQPFTLGGKYFEIGRRYYILLNGCHGDICDYLIKVTAGKQSFQLAEPGPIQGAQSFCPDSLDHLFSIDNIPGTSLYQWYINDTLFANTVLPEVNIRGLDPGFYQLKVRSVNSCDTTNTSQTLFHVTPRLILSNITHLKINIDSAYQIVFSIDGGIGPYTVSKGRGIIDFVNNIFYSDTLLCKSSYEIEIADAQGCTIAYQGYENCNCNSVAGTMPMDTIKVCESQSFTVKFTGSEIQDPGDAGAYILFSNPQNPLSSILKISTNGLFPFDPAKYKFNIYYYVSRVVGRKDIRGDIRFSHPCLSLSNFQAVIFRARPIVSAGPDLTYCGFEGTLNSFGNYTEGLWKFVSGPGAPAIINPIADQSSVIVNVYGTYIFSREVSNSFCTHKDEVKITFIETLKPVVGGFYFVCDGQSTILDGGDYAKFLWSTGDTTKLISVNTLGTYCVTVSDAANCTGSTCVAVGTSTAPVPHISGTDTLCTGNPGFLLLTQTYLKYSWNTQDSSSILQIDTGGIYCVTVTGNNGCTGNDCIEVVAKARSFSNRIDTVCFGDNYTLHGQTFDQPGLHDVILDNASVSGCDSVIRVQLGWYPQIVLADTNIIQDDGTGSGAISIIVAGGKLPYKYQWSNGAKTAIITNLIGGDYTLIVTDANNCHAAFTLTVKKRTSTNSVQKGNSRFHIYPNPVHTKSSLVIENKSDESELRLFIYNANGFEVYKSEWKSNGMNDILPLNLDLYAGIYFIKILDASGRSDIQKIIFIN